MTDPMERLAALRDRALTDACMAFWLGEWGSLLAQTARLAVVRGLTIDQACHALAFAYLSVTTQGDPA